MSREDLRLMKRLVSKGRGPTAHSFQVELARVSAVALLDRSILLGHDRLAVLRLSRAAQLGATLTTEHWAYCKGVVEHIRDVRLISLLVGADQRRLSDAYSSSDCRELGLTHSQLESKTVPPRVQEAASE
jgi:hypothetical protein